MPDAERGLRSPGATPVGFHLVGEYVGRGPGRVYRSRSGVERQPFKLTILVGRTTHEVEYPDEVSADAAVPPTTERMAVVGVRVFPRIGGRSEAVAQTFIVLGGERSAPAGAPGE